MWAPPYRIVIAGLFLSSALAVEASAQEGAAGIIRFDPPTPGTIRRTNGSRSVGTLVSISPEVVVLNFRGRELKVETNRIRVLSTNDRNVVWEPTREEFSEFATRMRGQAGLYVSGAPPSTSVTGALPSPPAPKLPITYAQPSEEDPAVVKARREAQQGRMAEAAKPRVAPIPGGQPAGGGFQVALPKDEMFYAKVGVAFVSLVIAIAWWRKVT